MSRRQVLIVALAFLAVGSVAGGYWGVTLLAHATSLPFGAGQHSVSGRDEPLARCWMAL